MEGRLAILLFLGAIVSVSSYPDIVPPSEQVCKTMTPGHGGAPKKSPALCKVTSSKDSVRGGDQVQVMISAVNPGSPFRGYYLQARDAHNNQIGEFTAAPLTKVHACGGIKATGAHHSSRDDKKSITVRWTAPSNYDGTVIFTATCVQDFSTYWTLIQSAPVEIVA